MSRLLPVHRLSALSLAAGILLATVSGCSDREANAESAVAAPDRIAFTRLADSGSSVATIDPATGRVRTLAAGRGRFDSEPAWSPDGRRLAFARSTDGRRRLRLHVMRADGSGVRRITDGRFDDRPAWSPDGRWIAFQSTTGIRLVRPDGTGARRLPGSGAGDARPAWSPGGRISFTTGGESSQRIVVQRIDGTARRTIARGWSSHWSPDGRTVAMTGPEGGVFTVSSSGGTPRRLARGYEPAWSPDGRRLAFTRWGEGDRMELWVIRRDGTGARRLRRDAEAPDWRPR